MVVHGHLDISENPQYVLSILYNFYRFDANELFHLTKASLV